MANNKMLIDASHPEETRVVVQRGNRVEEFDFEAANKKQLRGNIYLAKVTRVEPSLQAAFVDYGGNRHGFLAFSEIHPDYYQIPVADRQALLAEEAAQHVEEEEENRPQHRRRRNYRDVSARKRTHSDGEVRIGEAEILERQDDSASESSAHLEAELGDESASVFFSSDRFAPFSDFEDISTAPDFFEQEASFGMRRRDATQIDADESLVQWSEPQRIAAKATFEDTPHRIALDQEGYARIEEDNHLEPDDEDGVRPDHEFKARALDERDALRPFDPSHENEDCEIEEDEEEEIVEQIGGDAMEEMPHRQPRLRRRYKIQEVIKRRQVLLVQVVKEERGNKGAALTTYLSLAGRYSVLMPNTARGGGISRKITDLSDRKRMKEIVHDLEVPEGMGVILRTAGASRTRAEVKRDFEYLLRMWETVREMTLRSTAPMLVYEEGSLIKRAIRDLYNKEIDEIIVSGELGYREAKDFMRLLMPSHARCVRAWREAEALFVKNGVESQLDAMFSSQVTLRSGGYLVINQTEALVAIDVNSGRSTREHNIEDTALRTNIEAAEEIARQLRLRDLAGLIVVDFIDMEEPRNNRAVERKLKEALKNDRARIQVGRISHFGLLEMSRQRIRSGVLEGSTVACPHCMGAGAVRSTSSIALHVLRVLEEALIKSSSHNVIVKTRTNVALYILNQKRDHLREIEQRFGVMIFVVADDSLTGSTYHAFERGELASGTPAPVRIAAPISPEIAAYADELEDSFDDIKSRVEEEEFSDAQGGLAGIDELSEEEEEEEEAQRPRRRRRRRRGRNGQPERDAIALLEAPQPSDEGLAKVAEAIGEFPARNTTPQWREPRKGYWESEDSGHAQAFDAPVSVISLPVVERSPAVNAESATLFEEKAPPLHVKEIQPTEQASLKSDSLNTSLLSAYAEKTQTESNEAQTPLNTEAYKKNISSSPDLVITEADPSKPKKGGWWQRAKATLSGS